jgi:sulfide:quinone oxidoreductase
MGAGIGGISQIYELRKELGTEHELILVGDSERFEFTPSNPWVAVGWRKEGQITIDLPDLMEKNGIAFHSQGVKRLHAETNCLELNDGNFLNYDYLIIATGPKLAFEEVTGLGPDGFTQSICKTGHAAASSIDFDKLVADPGPVIVGAAPGASCFGNSWPIPALSSWVLHPAHPVSARPTNTYSSSIRNSRNAKFAIACPCTSLHLNRISVTSDSTASAIQKA